ncbi:MAG: alpha/beta hydrolase [Bacteroidota bacterium]
MNSILFLHGALASSNQFDTLRAKMEGQYKTYALNFSGHGGQMLPISGLNFTVFVDDILKFLDSNKIEKINLFGYSMGGYAALMFALKYPERVEKIFTCSVKLKWDLASAVKESEMLNADKIAEKVPAFANNLMLTHGINLWKNLLKSTSDMMMDLANGQLLTDEDFTKISKHVLLAIGDRDKTASLNDTLDVYKRIPTAELLVMPNAPHEFNKIDTDLIALQVQRFFMN